MKVLLLATLVAAALADSHADVGHGFRSDVDWVPYNQAIGVAKDLNKPIFLLIHKTWCGACKALKREFQNAAKIADFVKLSEKFVMVNTEDDEEPEDEKFAPDGGYIPRILFLDTDGEPLKTNNEQKYRNNKYFYPLIPQIIDGMERALLEYADATVGDEPAPVPVKEEKKEEKKEKKEKKEDKKEKEEKKEDKKEKKEKKEDKKEKKDKKSKNDEL